jgi:predicted dienelactone hydrolase
MKLQHWLVAAALAIPTVVTAQVEDTVTVGGRTAVVWRPNERAATRHPVVIFSHGLGGCPTQSRFLTAGLATRGYLVIAPFHHDAGCGKRKVAPRPPFPFSQPARWSDDTYADRIADVRAIVAALPSSSVGAFADPTELAVAGHSLGGYTALSLGGAWTLTRMPGVRAVLALAPYAAPFLAHGTMSDFSLPVMFQSGALDDGITAEIRKRGGAFDEARGPKYFVEFKGARHSSWGNKPFAAHDAMLSYAAAFLDRYVRGESDRDDVLTSKLTGVVELRGPGSTQLSAADLRP